MTVQMINHTKSHMTSPAQDEEELASLNPTNSDMTLDKNVCLVYISMSTSGKQVCHARNLEEGIYCRLNNLLKNRLLKTRDWSGLSELSYLEQVWPENPPALTPAHPPPPPPPNHSHHQVPPPAFLTPPLPAE